MRLAAWSLPLLLTACFIDAVGQPPGTDSGGAGAGPNGGAGAGEPVGAGTSNGAGGSGAAGTGAAGAGGAASAVCGDSVVEGSEQCEDGNAASNDGCDAACAFELGTCNDGTFQAGETCAPTDVDCTDCALTAGPCFSAPLIPLGITTQTWPAQTQLPFPNLCNVQGASSSAYRFDVGPYPRGILLAATEGNGAQWPAIWVSYGCGSQEVVPCETNPGPVARVVTPILDPGLSVFVGTADESNLGGSYNLTARPFRGHWANDQLLAWDTSSGGWSYDGTFEDLADYDFSTESMSRALAAEVYVGGLDEVRIAVLYGMQGNGAARIIASTDGGQTFVPVAADLPTNDFAFGAVQERPFSLAGATSLIVGVEFENPAAGTGQVWFDRVGVFED